MLSRGSYERYVRKLCLLRLGIVLDSHEFMFQHFCMMDGQQNSNIKINSKTTVIKSSHALCLYLLLLKYLKKYVYLYHVFFISSWFNVSHHHKEDSTLVPLTSLQSQRGNNLLKTVCFTWTAMRWLILVHQSFEDHCHCSICWNKCVRYANYNRKCQ